ncbi:MAG: cytochrome c biogenesis protein CcdA [Rhodothermales bacterium]|nr:cytochrome c biogenesis protein CcdA [Rhodothermales bacterium]
MSLARLVAFCTVAGALLAPGAGAQTIGPATDYVTWTAYAEPPQAEGGAVLLSLRASIDAGWKMYALDAPPPTRALRVELGALPAGLAAPDTFYQEGARTGYDPNFRMDVRYFADRAEVWAELPARAPEGGRATLDGRVFFQICNDRLCLPPTSVPFAAALRLPAAPAGAPPADPEAAVPPSAGPPSADPPRFVPDDAPALEPEAPPVPETDAAVAPPSDFEASRAGGLWGFLLLAVGAGLAALLTPCVFPMIPLTVSYFTKHAGDPGAAVRMALVYGGAIVLTFTGLGVLMALLVGAAGAQSFATNPWVNLFIGLVFVLFALSLLGLFELRVPSGLVNFFNRKSSEKMGYTGVLFMGFTLTLVSFSCTAPFVGGLLAATTQGAWSYPILGMLVFSATFSLPFMFFALFPRALSALPRSGSWMNAVKVVLGFIELAAALKFLSNADLVWGWGLISRTLAIALIVVLFFLAGLYLIGRLPLKHEPAPEAIGVGRLLFAIAFFGLSLYMLPGLLGAPLNKLDAYLPPRQSDDVSLYHLFPRGTAAALDDEQWIVDDVEAAFAEAEVQDKPVLIDFTGYTCTNCREMEANVFTKPAIAERFARDFVLLRLYTDGPRDTELQRYQLELTGTVALPTYAVVSPRTPERPLVKLSGTVPVERFAAFLDEGAATYLRNLAAR